MGNVQRATVMFLGLLIVLACGALTYAQTADAQNVQTVAYWTFDDPIDLGWDASGNGNALFNGERNSLPTFRRARPAPAAPISTARLSWPRWVPWILSAAKNVRVNFWQKTEALGFIYEHSADCNTNPGAIVGTAGVGWGGADTAGVEVLAGQSNDDGFGPSPLGTWTHYVQEFRLGEADPVKVVRVWMDGQLQPDAPVWGHLPTTGFQSTMGNDPVYFGGRGPDAIYPFVGNLDQIKIVDLDGGQTIGQWNFDTDNFLADSSGNGHDLQILPMGGVTSDPDGVGGSAHFEGGGVVTTDTVDMSPYTHFSISWRQKTLDGVAVVFESTADSNDPQTGLAFTVTANEGGVGQGTFKIKASSTNVSGVTVPHNTDNTWDEYSAEVDITQTDPNKIIALTRNGELLTDPILNPGMFHSESSAAFLNDVLYLAARGGSILPYLGSIDEFKIETFTIPDRLLGDANGDDVVNDEDASILGSHWLASGGYTDGDFNEDGVINDKDAAILAAHWGETAPGASVPEPQAILLLLTALGGLWTFRRR